jgi:HAD superfamily hydrolase (TIGR01490 family)
MVKTMALLCFLPATTIFRDTNVKLAIFDLDNTLIAGDSDYAWGEFLITKDLVDPVEYARKNDEFYQQYQQQTLDIHAYQAFVLAPLTSLDHQTKQALHLEFMKTMINKLRLDKSDKLIKDHKDAGDKLIIITATNSFISAPIGKWLGIDIVIATDPEVVAGQFTGKLSGTPCFQEGKITRLKQWLSAQDEDMGEIIFYSDSINDLPLLEYVDYPIAVDPDDLLRAHATDKNWPIISLRD